MHCRRDYGFGGGIAGRSNRLAVFHHVNGLVMLVEDEGAVMPVIGIHPLAKILAHPLLVMRLGEVDGVVPDRDTFLFAHQSIDCILQAVCDECFLALQGIVVGAHGSEEAEADDQGQREHCKRQHGQRDLGCQGAGICVRFHGLARLIDAPPHHFELNIGLGRAAAASLGATESAASALLRPRRSG